MNGEYLIAQILDGECVGAKEEIGLSLLVKTLTSFNGAETTPSPAARRSPECGGSCRNGVQMLSAEPSFMQGLIPPC
jgi:hypothetical protein